MRRHAATAAAGHGSAGQSLVEFTLLLPLFLLLLGVAIDVSRLYAIWINVESSTRDAAQWVAGVPAWFSTGGYFDPLDVDNRCGSTGDVFPCVTAPTADAKRVLDAQVGIPFVAAATAPNCRTVTAPTVYGVIAAPPNTSASAGGSGANPVVTAAVTACYPFRTLYPWPLLAPDGVWALSVTRTFSVIVGR